MERFNNWAPFWMGAAESEWRMVEAKIGLVFFIERKGSMLVGEFSGKASLFVVKR
jgi:hypothetical protein